MKKIKKSLSICCSNPSIKVDFVINSKGVKVPYEYCINCGAVFNN